jgi:hypothetical protein
VWLVSRAPDFGSGSGRTNHPEISSLPGTTGERKRVSKGRAKKRHKNTVNRVGCATPPSVSPSWIPVPVPRSPPFADQGSGSASGVQSEVWDHPLAWSLSVEEGGNLWIESLKKEGNREKSVPWREAGGSTWKSREKGMARWGHQGQFFLGFGIAW